MEFLRYKIKPLSSFITPIMSDTLFGHFCWFLRYEKGERFLQEFLEKYTEKKNAPVLFSCAFMSDHLPRPILAPIKRSQMNRFIEKQLKDKPINKEEERKRRFKIMQSVKSIKKKQFIKIKDFCDLKGDFSEIALFEKMFNEYDQYEKFDEYIWSKAETLSSNTISRVDGTVIQEGGGLFTRKTTWLNKNSFFDIYVKTRDKEFAGYVNTFFTTFLPGYGFGKDKSIGMGHFYIEKDNSFDSTIFDQKDSNACMVLSLTAFPGIDKFNQSSYRLTTKFGKLGGNFSFSSPSGGQVKPFKKPLLMMEPGSIFFTDKSLDESLEKYPDNSLAKSLETMDLISNIHTDERIKHCGIPITLPLMIKEGE